MGGGLGFGVQGLGIRVCNCCKGGIRGCYPLAGPFLGLEQSFSEEFCKDARQCLNFLKIVGIKPLHHPEKGSA